MVLYIPDQYNIAVDVIRSEFNDILTDKLFGSIDVNVLNCADIPIPATFVWLYGIIFKLKAHCGVKLLILYLLNLWLLFLLIIP